jgi:hypothetical protein
LRRNIFNSNSRGDGHLPGSDLQRLSSQTASMFSPAEMQHQDQQELGDYRGPQQQPLRVYSDETRLTQGAARRGLSDRQAAAWTLTGRHQDSPTKGQVGRYAAVQGSSSDRRGEDYRGWPLRQRLELLAFDGRLAGVPWALREALWEAIDALPARPHRRGAAWDVKR